MIKVRSNENVVIYVSITGVKFFQHLFGVWYPENTKTPVLPPCVDLSCHP